MTHLHGQLGTHLAQFHSSSSRKISKQLETCSSSSLMLLYRSSGYVSFIATVPWGGEAVDSCIELHGLLPSLVPEVAGIEKCWDNGCSIDAWMRGSSDDSWWKGSYSDSRRKDSCWKSRMKGLYRNSRKRRSSTDVTWRENGRSILAIATKSVYCIPFYYIGRTQLLIIYPKSHSELCGAMMAMRRHCQLCLWLRSSGSGRTQEYPDTHRRSFPRFGCCQRLTGRAFLTSKEISSMEKLIRSKA
jgi:hypothetical protein